MAKGNLWISLIAGILIYFVMTIYGDYEKVLTVISSFHLEYIPVLLVLAFTNYLLRAFSRYFVWT